MSWQHYLYSKLGKKEVSEEIIEKPTAGAAEKIKTKEQIIQETAERIVAMAKVLYGLHMVSLSFYIIYNENFDPCHFTNHRSIMRSFLVKKQS